jgi:hypothetical protein
MATPNVEYDAKTQLTNYSAHANILTQAATFFTHITTSIAVYLTISAAAWATVIARSLSWETSTWLLLAHILLSGGIALGVLGMGNQLIQRLNFAERVGEVFWKDLVRLGKEAWNPAWTPTDNVAPPRPSGILQKARSWLRSGITLRGQRYWFILPCVGAAVSVVLIFQEMEDGPKRRDFCRRVAVMLAMPEPTRGAIERARYLFDKANCDVTQRPMPQLIERLGGG